MFLTWFQNSKLIKFPAKPTIFCFTWQNYSILSDYIKTIRKIRAVYQISLKNKENYSSLSDYIKTIRKITAVYQITLKQ